MSVESMLDKIVGMLSEMKVEQKNTNERLDSIESRLDGLEVRLDGLEMKTTQIGFRLENLENKVDTLAEVVEANRQQNERQRAEITASLGKRIEIVERNFKSVE